jgi:hypothetical protein
MHVSVRHCSLLSFFQGQPLRHETSVSSHLSTRSIRTNIASRHLTISIIMIPDERVPNQQPRFDPEATLIIVFFGIK